MPSGLISFPCPVGEAYPEGTLGLSGRLLPFNTVKRADNGRVAHMIVVGDSPQTQALVANHAGRLPLLVRRQPRLRTKSHSTFFGSGSTTVRARQDAGALVLGESGEKRRIIDTIDKRRSDFGADQRKDPSNDAN